MPVRTDLYGNPLPPAGDGASRPIQCVHLRNPNRLRPHRMLRNGVEWELCSECHDRLLNEFQAVADEEKERWKRYQEHHQI